MNYEINLDNNKTLEIREAGSKYAINLADRLLKFAVDIIKYLFLLPFVKESDEIKRIFGSIFKKTKKQD